MSTMAIVENILDHVVHTKAVEAPPQSRGQRSLDTILQQLVEESHDIIGALVTSADGLPRAQILSHGLDPRRFAAMSSAMMALSDTLAREAVSSRVVNTMIEGANGNIYVLHAGRNLSLTVFTGANPNLGMTLAQARRRAEEIAAIGR